MSTLLKIENMSVAYGKVPAVENVSLKVERGAIVSVIGPNGAGKTTLLNAIMGLHPFSGSLEFSGVSLRGVPVSDRVATGLGLVPEKRELFGPMSVADNLELGGYSRRATSDDSRHLDLQEAYRLFPRLAERSKQKASTLSGGERQMLAIARALMARPRLLMLDEPSLGLAPLIVREVFEIVKSLRERGVSILIVEQNARAALQIADYGYVLETGTLALEGSAEQLANDPKVVQTYLGI